MDLVGEVGEQENDKREGEKERTENIVVNIYLLNPIPKTGLRSGII